MLLRSLVIGWMVLAVLPAHAQEAAITVQCVKKEDGQPVANASVHYRVAGPATPELMVARDAAGGDVFVAAQRLSKTVVTDDEGKARIVTDQSLQVLASTPNRRGVLRSPVSPGQTATVELEPVQHVDVRTLDASGAPKPGMPVVLTSERGDETYEVLRVISGKDGRARLAWQPSLRQDAETRISVRAGTLRAASPGTPLKPPGAEPGVIDLTVPQSGQLDMRLDAPPPTRGGAWFVEVKALGAPEERKYYRLPFTVDQRRIIPGIRLGERLRLWVMDGFTGRTAQELEIVGPTKAGETVVVRLDPRPGALLRVRGQLRDAEGPLAEGTRLRAWFWCRGVDRRESVVTTLRAGGVFSFPLPAAVLDPTLASARWVVELVPGADAAARSASVEVVGPEGLRDLGKLRVTEAPVISGRVLDSSGQPVGGATIGLSWLEDEKQRELWREFGNLDHEARVSDVQGRFAVLLPTPARAAETRLKISVGHRDFAYFGREFLATESPLELRLNKTLRVTGRLKLPGEASLNSLQVRLVPEVASGSRDYGVPAIRTGHLLEWGLLGLEPGRYTVIVTLEDEVILRREGIELKKSGTPPALQPLDLTKALRLVTLEVVDRDGRPVPSGRVRRLGGFFYDPEGFFENGVARAFVGEKPTALKIFAPGFRAVTLETVDSSRTVVMHPALRVVLRPTKLPKLPEGFVLGVWLRPRRVDLPEPDPGMPPHPQTKVTTGPFRPDAAMIKTHRLGKESKRVLLDDSGPHGVVWHLYRSAPGGWSETAWQFTSEALDSVGVKEQAEDQIFDLEIAKKDLEAALDSLRKSGPANR